MRPPRIGAEVKSAGFRMIFEDFSTKNEKKLLCLLSIFHRVVRENPYGRTDLSHTYGIAMEVRQVVQLHP